MPRGAVGGGADWGGVMRVLGRIVVALLVILLCAVPALILAVAMANTGLLGTCFEGACGYAAFFGVFPVLWILFSILAVIALWRLAWRGT